MSDQYDKATELEELQRSISLSKVMNVARVGAEHHKECMWCGDPTEGGARWCSKECRDDQERYRPGVKYRGQLEND